MITAPGTVPDTLRHTIDRWVRPRWSAAPEFVVAALVAVALAAATTASLGIHRPYTTLPLAAVATWGVWRAVRPHNPRETPQARRGATWVLLGVIVWIGVGIVLAGEYLIVTRDPGFLTLSGVWLTDHASTDIPTLGAIPVAQLQPNLLADAWQAWNLDGDVVQPQGAKALPALISVGGWVAGVPGVLAANVFVGGVGVLAVYNVARRFLTPLAALAPAATVALTVSHLGLSRSAYSEPLTLLLVFASIQWAWRGLAAGRPWALIVAGVASGATALVRVDGGVYALGVLIGVALAGAFRGPQARSGLMVFGLAQAAVVGAGYASVARWSAAYVERLGPEVRLLGAAYAVILFALIVWAATWSSSIGARLSAAVEARPVATGRVFAMVTVGASVVLASRPLWMTAQRGTTSETDKFTNTVVKSFQQAEGYAIEPTRTYAEHTVTWLSYYLTWPLLALAMVGLAVLAYRAVTARFESWVFLAAVAVPSLLYLVRPQIVPDQLWAIRRFEPATLPGVALAAGVGAWWLAHRLALRWPQARHRLVASAAVILVAAPVTTYISIRPAEQYPVTVAAYAYVREQQGARAQIDALCRVADGRPIILAGSSSHFGSLRVMCDVPVVLALEKPTPTTLQRATEIWGEAPVVLTRDSTWFWESAPAPVVTSTTFQGEYALQRMPRMTSTRDFTWFAGVVGPDGALTPLNPDGSPAP